MKLIKIDNEGWEKGLEKLNGSYRMFGPFENQDSHAFKQFGQGESPDMSLKNTHLSAKSVVYPQSQVMFEYTTDETKDDHHIMKEVATDEKPAAVFGIRPCDAASFLLVQRNFDSPEYKDPYWVKPYEASTFVGLACDDPDSTCFCTSAGGGPYSDNGLDLLLSQEEGGFTCQVITEKGEALAKSAGWDTAAEGADFEGKKQAAEKKISVKLDSSKLKDQKTTELFSAEFWDDVAFSCLNCGTCTFSCPTCWCFDIQDENQGTDGKRMRNWDSCMYPLFTLEGSGHNPRPSKVQRVRQRFMHKLKYYVDKYEAGIQCVGCGRCIRLCPVNIDIRTVCDKMNYYQSA
ncbi:MAG: 4Fe-4S dicluster domain-containing protein [Deltaproteobacteria bacterium]|nr:4Fe-4S dicluster domain-containing protein [Deltaproteobacteria bacterium]MBT4268215.1 4Fe-4S dicluster domain-containing protein [Deltaproteobacteria bacterium]MBT4640156.1 4Fe-4S dicluster domain-containing protein [Deltaproteobacteria bacterium]MBT6500691.1 4Fe-4S dicluster domain-containing protein [Deltaproteobacteria bacterium]MBT6614234.1 4Fe-4S dicluster domain-containing protein [Deltaproteobacteria bacterium]